MSVTSFDRATDGEDVARPDTPQAPRNERLMQDRPTPHGATIRISGLVKRYGAVAAVDDVSLDVAPGEFISLLGPSGSGKTTTLMMVAGFVLPDQGKILLGGRDITQLAPYRRNIGMVHQSYALFPHMNVRQNVAFPLRMRGMGKAEIARRVDQALGLVQLTGFDHRKPGQLSGGQQQRVALARALVFEPPLLLMDEPLGALDKKLRVDLQIEIKRIQREIGSTMLYVTHDQEEALSMSDRIVVMNHGRIEQIDTPGRMYDQPSTRFVADFLGTSNFITATVEVPGLGGAVRTAAGLRLTANLPKGARPGDRLELSLRPERVQLVPDGGAALVRGTVMEASYFGNTQRYALRLEDGEPLIATRPSLGQPVVPVGTALGLAWNPDDIWIIPQSHT